MSGFGSAASGGAAAAGVAAVGDSLAAGCAVAPFAVADAFAVFVAVAASVVVLVVSERMAADSAAVFSAGAAKAGRVFMVRAAARMAAAAECFCKKIPPINSLLHSSIDSSGCHIMWKQGFYRLDVE